VSVRPTTFYVDRARKALRLQDEITVIGFGNRMSAACTIVETLKRQKIAKIHKLETTMDMPLLNTNNNVTFARPLPKITIHLHRGEFAHYISGYQQRKVIEIFENIDKNSTGRLSIDEVNELDFPNAFHGTDEHKKHAIKEIHGKSQVTLSDFIRFASYCINPQLRDNAFQQIVEKRYGIRPQNPPQHIDNRNNDDDDDDHSNAADGVDDKPNDHHEENQHVNNK